MVAKFKVAKNSDVEDLQARIEALEAQVGVEKKVTTPVRKAAAPKKKAPVA